MATIYRELNIASSWVYTELWSCAVSNRNLVTSSVSDSNSLAINNLSPVVSITLLNNGYATIINLWSLWLWLILWVNGNLLA